MNWKTTIAEIQGHGLTQPQIAAICKCGQATISDLANGKTVEPRHSLGQALLALHAQYKRRETTSAQSGLFVQTVIES